jgi:phosphoesterase RecJ-like protein
VDTGDTEGIVNYALSMADIKLAAFIVDVAIK